MSTDQRRLADAHLDAALERAALQDPRDSYRERLRLLKDRDPAAFAEARRYYEETLVPRVATPGSDPIQEWLEYGLELLALEGKSDPGELLTIDPSGRAHTFTPPPALDHLVLYLPDDNYSPVFPLSVPLRLSPAQQASYDLLVLKARK